VVILVIIVMTVQPVVSIESSTRLIMAVLAFVLAFVWFQSDFSESARTQRKQAATASAATRDPAPATAPTAGSATRQASRPPDGTMADTVGRTAGRLAGKGVNLYREQAAKRRKK
jgi:hypothetical protein